MTGSLLNVDEIEAALVRQGTEPAQARRLALRAAGVKEADVPPPAPELRGQVVFPLTITLPWSCLVSDNDRKVPIVVRNEQGTTSGRMKLNPTYKAAREKVQGIAKRAVGNAHPASHPLELTARVYVPNRHNYDVCNYAKGVHDALEKIVYANDRWLHRTYWIIAGVDCDKPRAELTFTAIPDVRYQPAPTAR